MNVTSARRHEALEHLLSCYPYHSVLWNLYYVNTFFRRMKPINDYDKKLQLYCDTSCFYVNVTCSTLVEGFYVNKHICHLVVDGVVYIIPIEWIFRIVKIDGVFKLRMNSFCCRMNVVMKGETNAIYRQELCVDGINEYREMFHIGVGKCMDRESQIFHRDLELYFGWSLIYDYIKRKRCDFSIYPCRCRVMYIERLRDICMIDTNRVNLMHAIVCKNCHELYFDKLMDKYLGDRICKNYSIDGDEEDYLDSVYMEKVRYICTDVMFSSRLGRDMCKKYL